MGCTIIQGDCRTALRALPDESVHCVVTSPPYWSLRAYGTEPQVWGGDANHAHEWTAGHTVTKGGPHGPGALKNGGRGVIEAQAKMKRYVAGEFCACGAWRGEIGMEPTPDLFVAHIVEVFREVYRVLRDDGNLFLNIGDTFVSAAGGRIAGGSHFGKQNQRVDNGAIPSAAPNRQRTTGIPKKSKALIPFRVALALQDDGWIVRQDNIWEKANPLPESVEDRTTSAHEYVFHLVKSPHYFYDADAIREPLAPKTLTAHGTTRRDLGNDAMGKVKSSNFAASVPIRRASVDKDGNPRGANKRSVWRMSSQPTDTGHFATMPEALVEPCVKAGCPAGGTVLDPFAGTCTVGVVAARLGRGFIGIELNPEYAELGRARIVGDAPLLNQVERKSA